MEIATLAGGCFWCTETVFKRLKGVSSAVPGYSGGNTENPTYENIGDHAEAIQIKFDQKVISYETLLEVFFALHDATTLNRQGNDMGAQYRSAIFYHNDEQKKTAEELKSRIPNAVTEVKKFTAFYVAESYHQNYYENNKSAGYCRIIIDPKIQKLYKEFGEITKKQ